MDEESEITSLEQLLDRLDEADDARDRVAIGSMIEVVGQESFGPLLVFAGLIAFSPLSGIPGVPTLVAIIVCLTAGQLLCRRRTFWLPQWLIRRTVPRKRYDQALNTLRWFARLTDRLLRPRLTFLTRRAGSYFIAVVCILLAITMPPLELIPFAATSAGAAITALGLALMAHDGVMALVALAVIIASAIVVVQGLA